METWRKRFQIKWSWNKKGNSCSTNHFHKKKMFLRKWTAEQGLLFFQDHVVWNRLLRVSMKMDRRAKTAFFFWRPLYLKLFPSYIHGNESQSKDCLYFMTASETVPFMFHENESQSKDCLSFRTTSSETVSIVSPWKWIADQGLPFFQDRFIWNRSVCVSMKITPMTERQPFRTHPPFFFFKGGGERRGPDNQSKCQYQISAVKLRHFTHGHQTPNFYQQRTTDFKSTAYLLTL